MAALLFDVALHYLLESSYMVTPSLNCICHYTLCFGRLHYSLDIPLNIEETLQYGSAFLNLVEIFYLDAPFRLKV